MRARPSTLLVLLGLPLALGTAAGCGKQGEGERCDTLSGEENGDCETGLLCTPSDQLVGNLSGTAVCCPKEGQPITAPNCQPSSGFAGSPGVDGAGEATDGAADSDAAVCAYNSDCPAGLVCGPLGRCQAECVTDRDCPSPMICPSGTCTLPDSGNDSSVDSSIDSSIDSSLE